MQQFFGHPESPLFGVHHPPRGKQASDDRAVVICPPIGQEYIRTHWCLRLVANQISRGGAHVLRLDYQGMGDSFGRVEQIDSLAVWQNNIEAAIDQVKQISGAQTVMLLGQRFGGTLAAEVAKRRPDVNSVVLWEPVIDGQIYLNQLRTMHAKMLDLWVCKMSTQDDEAAEEILGAKFSRSLLKEIEALELCVGDIPQPQLAIKIHDGVLNATEHPQPSLQKIIVDDRPASWNDLRELESAYLRPAISRQIVKLVRQMFDRLEQFDALKLTSQSLGAEVAQ
jgi:pimeloyl-ACP methyl ester carboxylesterase